MTLRIAQDPEADRVLAEQPFALLMGMMLDQQFPMERAFAGPARVLDRFGTLDPVALADADPEEFAALCAVPPAVHRFPGRWPRGSSSSRASSPTSTTARPTGSGRRP